MIYPLAFPSQAPATQRLILNRRQSKAESPWTFAASTVDTAAQWALEWTWPAVSVAQAETLDAWLLSLKGQSGSFKYSPRGARGYSISGTTLALAAASYQSTISVKGWAANQSTGLRLGQWMTIGTQLLKITEAGAFSDANGAVAISFEPFLRVACPSGTAVNLTAPFGVFSLATSDGQGFTLTPDRLCDFGTLQAREVV